MARFGHREGRRYQQCEKKDLFFQPCAYYNSEKFQMTQEKSVFFPGINGLRFFAALAVIITHTELMKGVFGYEYYWNNPFIFNLGGLGVYFFFVLSGFLITFLLLREKEKQQTINIKAFYLRRILRIWPLYYLVVIIGFFILPHFSSIQIPYLTPHFKEHFAGNLLLYILILPNLAFALFPAVPHIGQLWSIGIEEQFYIVWPWIISKVKNTLRALIVIVVVLIAVKLVVLLLGNFYAKLKWYEALKSFIAMSKFECMAIGGIGAYYLHEQKEAVLKFIQKSLVLNLSILCIPFLIYFTPGKIQDAIHLVFSVAFLIIIMNVASNKKIWFSMENKYISYLGKISYGIYMYHFMIIPFIMVAVKSLYGNMHLVLFNIIVYALVITTTVAVSGLSYAVFEKRFIKMKSKFSIIKSGAE